ncbi:MAG: glycosyltransferase family 4 protein [Eubacterium sp.]|nr:glycosyltransferase family 4 protein [Eubacterium sp.]
MNYLIFGTGDYYSRFKKWFADKNVLGLLDNSSERQGHMIDGHVVYSVEEGVSLQYDAIIILSFYYQEMRDQLLGLGVPEDKIYHFYDLHKLLLFSLYHKDLLSYQPSNKIRYCSGTMQGRIVLLSNDLSLGGPALALLHMGEILARNGWEVVFGSMEDGPLRSRVLNEGFPITIDPNLQVFSMKECAWTKEFDIVVCNTINYNYFLSQRGKDAKCRIIWWLHDSPFFYQGVDKKRIKEMDLHDIQLVSVGPVPEMAFREFRPDAGFKRLNYMVPDLAGSVGITPPTKKFSEKVRFLTIGYIEWRKGQDLLIEAFNKLNRELQKECEFVFIGQDSSAMATRLKQETIGIPDIIFTGKVNRDQIHQYLLSADALIIPSREDPMPTVAAEAMMHGVPCIVSSSTGTAQYITDGKNGLIFSSGDADDLAETISKFICFFKDAHHSLFSVSIQEMRNSARSIYEQEFSETAFRDHLQEVMKLDN